MTSYDEFLAAAMDSRAKDDRITHLTECVDNLIKVVKTQQEALNMALSTLNLHTESLKLLTEMFRNHINGPGHSS